MINSTLQWYTESLLYCGAPRDLIYAQEERDIFTHKSVMHYKVFACGALGESCWRASKDTYVAFHLPKWRDI